MSNVNTDGLPPEMQARIAQIIEGAKQKAVANTQPQPEQQAPIVKPPSLMDHVVALRQDICRAPALFKARRIVRSSKVSR